jgi:nitronate monooxygenase
MSLKSVLPSLIIKGKAISVPIIQGGMGIGVSMSPLASAVAQEGGLGVVSTAAIDRLVSKKMNRKVTTYEAVCLELLQAKSHGGSVGVNIMVAISKDYEACVRAAIDTKIDVIISGGGLPLTLPAIKKPDTTALVPVVSSARALEVICKKWERHGYRPDAAILEGPLAGGHLGFAFDEIQAESHTLENLFPLVKETAVRHGDFPIVVAGGVFSHEDIIRYIKLGADGVQMGTRFLVTEESSASLPYKLAVIDAKKEDIVVSRRPASPCGMPFRALRNAPMYLSTESGTRKPLCDKGYLLFKDREGKYLACPANREHSDYFCICNGLLSSAGFNPDSEAPLYTVGSNAYRVTRILPVKELMGELTGLVPA